MIVPVRHRALLVAALAALAVVAAPTSSRAAVLGVNTSAVQGWFKDAPTPEVATWWSVNAGAQTGRMGVSWPLVQPKPDVWKWQKYDREIEAMVAAGIRPILMLHDAPYWADKGNNCSTKHCPPDGKHLGAWAHFAKAAARRYPEIIGIEIWNSANTKAWWPVPGGANPAQYARLVSWAANAIHKVRPHLPVLFCSCGGAGFEDKRGTLSIPTFLSGFYRYVNWNALGHQDGLAVHAYPHPDEIDTLDRRFARVLREARTARDTYDRNAHRKLWLTEMGVTTTGPWAVSRGEQSQGIQNAIDAVNAMSDVAAVYVFTLIETRWNSKRPEEQGYGIIRRGEGDTLIAKKAWCDLAIRAGTGWTARSKAGC